MLDVLAQMATSVWNKTQEEADLSFIQKTHFDRMGRRFRIARVQDKTLDKIFTQKTVTLNSRQLLGFKDAIKKLENHPILAEIMPSLLSEIHGDLNIHNVLSRLDTEDDEDVVLIDPRGVPLLDDDSDKVFECGDYCYDISKLLFSLTGFSKIRKGLFNYSSAGDSHSLIIHQHPGLDTTNGAARLLIPELEASKVMRQWIEEVEKHGARSFEL